MANKLEQQYPQFFELNGTALNDGYIYIGVNGLNPETNPIPIFLDEDLTTPISQPLRTSGGYIYYNGSPVSIYFNESTYSITVKNSLSNLIYTILSNNAFSYPKVIDTIEELATYTGTGLVMVKDLNRGGNFVSKTVIEIDPNTGSLYVANGGTVFAKLGGGFWVRQYSGAVNIKWFGAVGDSNGTAGNGTDNYLIIQYVHDNFSDIDYGTGIYRITNTLTDNGSTIQVNGVISKGITGLSTDNTGTVVFVDGDFEGMLFTSPRSSMINIKILGDNGAFNADSSGLHINNAARGLFKNITIEKCRGHGLLHEKGNATTFINIVALSNKGHGVSVDALGATPDNNACTFINIDTRLNGLDGLYTNNSFANNYYNVVSQGNVGWGVRLNSNENNIFGLYVESNGTIGESGLRFDVGASANYVYGVYTNSTTWYDDLSVNQRNYIAQTKDFSAYGNFQSMQIGKIGSGINGTLLFKEGDTNFELALEGTSSSMILDITSNSTGTLTINPDAISIGTPVECTLQNSWVSASVNGYGSPKSFVDKYGIVHLEGVMKDGTTAINTVLTQLDTEQRPNKFMEFNARTDIGTIGIKISSAGVITLAAAATGATKIFLDGITFRRIS